MTRNPFKLEDHYDESFALEDDEEEEEEEREESLADDQPTPTAPSQRPASARHGGRGRPVSGRFRPAQPQKPANAYEDSENESSELESTDDEFNVRNHRSDRPAGPEPSRSKTNTQNKQNMQDLQTNQNNYQNNSPFASDEESEPNFNTNQRNPVPNQHSNQNLNPSSDETESDNDSGTNNSDESDGSENLYNPDVFKNLQVSKEIKDLFTHIGKYKPKKTPLLQKLRPFIPEYVPAVGDIDAFLKIPRPDGKDEQFGLGWQVLDEPSLKQTDPAILDQTLKSLGNQENSNQMNFVHSVENAEKNSKRVESWIDEITELNRSKPAQTVTFSKPMPDVESIMTAWPEKTERVLRQSQIMPSAEELDCSLEQYAKMVCTMFDVPVYEGNPSDSRKPDNQLIQSLHVLFSTYSQFKQLEIFNKDDGMTDSQINSNLLTSTSNLDPTSNSQRNTNNRNVPKSSDVMTFN
jgi:intraflagellar transport protein 46